MCPINNDCEQLCALEITDNLGSGSGSVISKLVCSCLNGFTLDANMKTCTGKCVSVCPCVWSVSVYVCLRL